MSFPFNAYLAAVVGAFLTTIISFPLWRQWCLRTGLVDEPGYRKIHDQPIPLAGGLTVLTGLLIPILVFAGALWWQSEGGSGMGGESPRLESSQQLTRPGAPLEPTAIYLLQYGMSRRAVELGAILLGALGMLCVGLLDDKHELRPGAKFAGQLLIAGLVAASGVRITLFVHSQLFQYTVTILWILAVINAFNFMDNMNGLCAGLGAI